VTHIKEDQSLDGFGFGVAVKDNLVVVYYLQKIWKRKKKGKVDKGQVCRNPSYGGASGGKRSRAYISTVLLLRYPLRKRLGGGVQSCAVIGVPHDVEG